MLSADFLMHGFGYESATVGPESDASKSYALQMCKYGLREPFPQHEPGQAISDSDSNSTIAHTTHKDEEARDFVYFRTLLAV
jgi:hypothetical protein